MIQFFNSYLNGAILISPFWFKINGWIQLSFISKAFKYDYDNFNDDCHTSSWRNKKAVKQTKIEDYLKKIKFK